MINQLSLELFIEKNGLGLFGHNMFYDLVFFRPQIVQKDAEFFTFAFIDQFEHWFIDVNKVWIVFSSQLVHIDGPFEALQFFKVLIFGLFLYIFILKYGMFRQFFHLLLDLHLNSLILFY